MLGRRALTPLPPLFRFTAHTNPYLLPFKKGYYNKAEVGPRTLAPPQVLRVGDAVTLTYKEGGEGGSAAVRTAGPHVVLEWAGGSEADMVADAVVAIILQVGGWRLGGQARCLGYLRG